MATLSKMGRAALAYAQKLGWPVLPLHGIKGGKCTCGKADCSSPGKHPLVANGVHAATKDPVVIVQWWQKWPDANVGIRCGRESGIFVIDVDGDEGLESLRELEEQYGKFPETPMQITGSGGYHIILRYPSDVEIRPRVRLLPGVDIRAEDSYVVAAPSIHISGRRYCWELEHHPLEIPLAGPPVWLLKLVSKSTSEETTSIAENLNDWADIFDDLIEGKRNTTLYRYMCHLLARGISCTEAFYLIHAVNRTYSKPPLPDSEIDNIVKSAVKWRLEEHEKRHAAVYKGSRCHAGGA